MGLLDKAKAAAQDAAEKGKKLAEQAQAKLDEAQGSSGSGQGDSPIRQAPATEYDEHGRPIPGESVADAVEDAAPLAEKAPQDTSPPQGDPLSDHEPPKSPPAPPSGGSGMTSGDPLAG